MAGAFGSLAQDAIVLATGDPTARLWIDPPLSGSGLKPPEPGERVRHFTLLGGRLVEEGAPSDRPPTVL